MFFIDVLHLRSVQVQWITTIHLQGGVHIDGGRMDNSGDCRGDTMQRGVMKMVDCMKEAYITR